MNKLSLSPTSCYTGTLQATKSSRTSYSFNSLTALNPSRPRSYRSLPTVVAVAMLPRLSLRLRGPSALGEIAFLAGVPKRVLVLLRLREGQVAV